MRVNPVAKSVRSSLYRPKIVKPKKGKGSYKRNKKNEKAHNG